MNTRKLIFPYPIFKTRLGWQQLPFGAPALFSSCCRQTVHREWPSETSLPALEPSLMPQDEHFLHSLAKSLAPSPWY